MTGLDDSCDELHDAIVTLGQQLVEQVRPALDALGVMLLDAVQSIVDAFAIAWGGTFVPVSVELALRVWEAELATRYVVEVLDVAE